jgi:hypothetical protein
VANVFGLLGAAGAGAAGLEGASVLANILAQQREMLRKEAATEADIQARRQELGYRGRETAIKERAGEEDVRTSRLQRALGLISLGREEEAKQLLGVTGELEDPLYRKLAAEIASRYYTPPTDLQSAIVRELYPTPPGLERVTPGLERIFGRKAPAAPSSLTETRSAVPSQVSPGAPSEDRLAKLVNIAEQLGGARRPIAERYAEQLLKRDTAQQPYTEQELQVLRHVLFGEKEFKPADEALKALAQAGSMEKLQEANPAQAKIAQAALDAMGVPRERLDIAQQMADIASKKADIAAALADVRAALAEAQAGKAKVEAKRIGQEAMLEPVARLDREFDNIRREFVARSKEVMPGPTGDAAYNAIVSDLRARVDALVNSYATVFPERAAEIRRRGEDEKRALRPRGLAIPAPKLFP